MECDPQLESSGLDISPRTSDWDTNMSLTSKTQELTSAAESGNWTLLDDLLSSDDVTRCDIEQNYILHRLAAAPVVSLSLARDIIAKIIKHQVDLNMVDTNKDTAIVLAARCDNTKMVMELLSRQAALPQDVTHVCSFLQTLTKNWKQEETPYMHALVVKLLWDRLQDTALHTCHKELHDTLVRLAVTFHTSLVREMFVTEQQVNTLDSEGMAVLHRLAMFDNDDYVRLVLFLISKGADVNLQNTSGATPLHVAAKYKNYMMMDALLHRGAKSDISDCKQRSVLHIMASYKHITLLSQDLSSTYDSRTLLRRPIVSCEFEKIIILLIHNNNDITKRDSKGNTALHLAALTGNIRLMKKLLDHGALADGVNDEEKTVLHMLAMTRYEIFLHDYWWRDVLLLAKKRGADFDRPDSEGNLAIHLAAKLNEWSLVNLLLEFVDDAAQLDSEGFNILHRFVMMSSSRDYSFFHHLSQKVGDINKKSQTGYAAIHLAAKCQNWDAVEYLVKEGALTDELDSEGLNIFHRLGMGKRYLLSFFMERVIPQVNAPSLLGDTALQLAARHENWFMVEGLVDYNYTQNIDDVDSEGFTLIQRLVSSNGSYSLFCRLLELGADYTCRDQNGDTVLHLAAKNDYWEIVQYLVQLGEQTDTPDSEGFVLLHRAATADTRNVRVKDLLHSILKQSPDVHKRTKRGDTALHLAAKKERWETVVLLAEHGANVFDYDSENTSAFQRMIRNQFSTMQEQLIFFQKTTERSRTEQLCTFVFEAAKLGSLYTVLILVNQGVSVHQRDSEGLNLLHIIAKREWYGFHSMIDCLECLLDKGINLEARCPNGNTPLHLAAKSNNWDLVRCLVEQGASIQSPDSDGVFVLQRLAMYRYFHRKEEELLRLLVKTCADVKICDSNGDSLLQIAARANNWFFVFSIIKETDDLDVYKLDRDGFSILHRLAQYDKGSTWVWKYFEKEFNLGIPNSNGDTCLLLAAKQENWTFVNCVLTHILERKQSPKIMLPIPYSVHVVSRSFKQVNHSTIQINLDKRDLRGYTVLNLAVKRTMWDVVEKLAECGAKMGTIDDEGLNTLQKLASDKFWNSTGVKDRKNLLKLLKQNGLNFQLKDELGNTPLQEAAKKRNFPIVFLLLDGADDFRCNDSDGLSLLCRLVYITPDSHTSELEKRMEQFLKSKADSQELSWEGNTPLHLAAKSSQWSIVSLLLKHGIHDKMCDSEGQSVLHRLARSYKDFEVQLPLIKELIQHGASIKQKDLQGNTPLHLAVQHQNWDVATELIQCGADVNELESAGYSVLHRVAQEDDAYNSRSYLSFTKLMNKIGSECDIPSNCGEIIFDIVAENDNWSMIESLFIDGKLSIGEHSDKSLLHRFASSYHGDSTHVCDFLIEKGFSVNAEDCDGNTPLHLAVGAGKWYLAKHLIQKGARGRKLDGQGQSILHRFVTDVKQNYFKDHDYGGERFISILDVFISSGVDVNTTDPKGNTALHIAAKRKLVDVVDRLMNSTDNLNTKDSEGYPALLRLSQIAEEDCVSLCKSLVQKGADIHICLANGESATHIAIKSHNWPMVEFLLSKDAQFNVKSLEQLHPFHRIIKCSDSTLSEDSQLKLMTLLINRGLAINLPDPCGKTPAELAFTYKKLKLFKYLLESGAYLNPTPKKRNSYFHELAKLSSVDYTVTDIIRLLTKSSLDINLQNNLGHTPVHVAAHKGSLDIVKTFLECGADIKKLDKNGHCLLHKLLYVITEMTSKYYPNLSKSTFESRVQLLKTLVKLGAEVNWRGPDSKTAVQIAAGRRDWEMVGVLIDLGAVCEFTPKEKQSALRILHLIQWKGIDDEKLKHFVNNIKNDDSDIDDFLLPYERYDQKTVLRRCIQHLNWRMAKALVECGADSIRMQTNRPLLELMMSVYSCSPSPLEWMSFLDLVISKGLNINMKLKNGSGVLFHEETIPSLSASGVQFCLFDILLKRGADPLAVDSRGQTLLRNVVDFSGKRALTALKKLLPTGVTTHQPRISETITQSQTVDGTQNASPIEVLIQKRNIPALKLLIESGASSNAELFRLNTEYQVKLAGQADSDDNVKELLEVLNMAVSQPRSLQSLCRLTVSHCVGCGPGRTDKLNRLPVPPVIRDLVSFHDLLSEDFLAQIGEDYLLNSSDYYNEFSDSDDDYYW